MKISVFGLGYVGSVSAACWASKGHQVVGVDSNKNKVAMINRGKALIIEPQLGELTEKTVASGHLRATDDAEEAILSTDLSFICVGTPSQKDDSLDLQYVRRVCEDMGRALKIKSDRHLVACRSTMLPGSMKSVVIPILENFSGKKDKIDFNACLNPEFMKEGTAIHDFFNPPKNIVGSNDLRPFTVLSKLNSSYTDMPTISLGLEEAELIKYCDNIWHALKVGYANEIGKICKRLEIDSHLVMDIFCRDTKLNISPHYLKPGLAFGGSCLPKDLRAFLHESQNLKTELPIISSILPSNNLHIKNALRMILEHGKKKIGILGFSFKADTDDLRESPMVEIIEGLIGKGYELTLFDGNVNQAKLHGANRDYILNHIPHISSLMVSSVQEVLDRSEVIVIGNSSKEYTTILDSLGDEQILIDFVRINELRPQRKQYHGICW